MLIAKNSNTVEVMQNKNENITFYRVLCMHTHIKHYTYGTYSDNVIYIYRIILDLHL